jgi:drug/metabolite transporter (DMT)-like permease
MDTLLPIALCLSSSLEALAIHFITNIQSHSIQPEQLILITECLKIAVSWMFLYSENLSINIDNIHWFFVPAFVYTICNNLIYFALKSITPSTFNLLSNFKIPMTILLAFLLLQGQYSFNRYQFLAIVLVFFGNTLAVYNPHGISVVNYYGVFTMLLYSLCSGIASVYCEFVMKIKFKDENVFLQNIKFSLCSIFCNLVLTIIYGHILHWYIEPIHILGIVFMANYGILTGIVLKNLGSVVKTYSTSLSVFVSILFSYFLWGYQISAYFMIGSIVSIAGISVYIYDKQSTKNVENNPYILLESEPELVWE